jgi:hypothetical protein
MKVLNPQSDALRDAIKKTGARLVANMFLIPIYEVESVGTHGLDMIFSGYGQKLSELPLRTNLTVITQKNPLKLRTSAAFAAFLKGLHLGQSSNLTYPILGTPIST